MKYARMFEHLGFNAVVYDHRRHGESEGKTTSYGHYEKLDLQKVVQAIREEIGENALLGIHGESMGAATMLLYAGTVENGADFYVSDCAFSNFPKLLEKVFRETVPIPSKYTIPFANVFLKPLKRSSRTRSCCWEICCITGQEMIFPGIMLPRLLSPC